MYVQLGDLTCDGGYSGDAGWWYSDLIGWDSLAAARGSTDSLPGGHGSYRRSVVLRDSLVITLKVMFIGETYTDALAGRDRLLALGGETPVVPLLVSDSAGIWAREVEVRSVTVSDIHQRRWFKAEIDMIAPDPRRYGPVQTVGPVGLPTVEGGVRFPQRTPLNFGRVSEASRLIVPNAGAIALHPRVMLSGGFSSVTVTDVTDGRSQQLAWPVGEGEVLTLDQGTRRAELSGQELTRWMSRRQWFTVPPGETHEFRFEVVGAVGDPQMWAEYKIGAW